MTAEGVPQRPDPFGRERLAENFRALGLRHGQHLLVHSSLRRVGRVDGGAATVLDSIRDAAGQQATLVVPTQTSWNSLSSAAFMAATAGLDAQERARYIAAIPGFDPASTPSSGMGAFAEYVRTSPGAVRSRHPQTSFAALGPSAQECMSVHDLDCHLGDRSPLGWLYEADAAILLLGVGYSVCTAFHLAEYRLGGPRRPHHCFTGGAQGRDERVFLAIELDDSDFESLGADLDATEQSPVPAVRHGQVGFATCRLVQLRAAVDFGARWLKDHRGPITADGSFETRHHQTYLSSQLVRYD
jgi:aminoglycoside 3-N-acetyltransferase